MFLKSIDLVCVLGSRADWVWLLDWLQGDCLRRLVIVAKDGDPLEPQVSTFLLFHPQVQFHMIESPIQIELIAKRVAWHAVLLKMAVFGGEEGSQEPFLHFRNILENTHRAANLLLSDVADFGCRIAKNTYLRGDRPVRRGVALENALIGVPAIIAGAGLSLAKALPYLEELSEKALILSGGAALSQIGIEPHFAASIDPVALCHPIKQAPFCFQDRMNFSNFSRFNGEAIFFPDHHLPIFEDCPFDGGWTVGTFLTRLAVLMGCNPILFVGMDLCYEGRRKYSGGKEMSEDGLLWTVNRRGDKVLTQPDWLMAQQWVENLVQQNPQRTWIDTAEEGLGFGPSVCLAHISHTRFGPQSDLRQRVAHAVQKLPLSPPPDWEQWRFSLQRCAENLDQSLQLGILDVEFEDASVYDRLLNPLWQVWGPFFERELTLDPQPDKLKWNQILFFQQVIQKHFDVYRT